MEEHPGEQAERENSDHEDFSCLWYADNVKNPHDSYEYKILA